MSAPVPEDIRRLIDRHLDGELSPEEGALLVQRLKQDAEVARLFARAAMLHDQARAIVRYDRQHARPASDHGQRRSRRRAIAAGAVVVLAAACAVLVLWRPSPGSPVVAQLNASADASWSDPNVAWTLQGGELPSGPLRLQSGLTEFVFGNGAVALVEGPALFEPLGPDRVSLTRGWIVARSPGRARLTVVTPHSRVTDLGTVFAVAVDRDQRTRVAVMEGDVELSAAGRMHHLRAGQSLIVTSDGQTRADPEAFGQLARLLANAPSGHPVAKSFENLLLDPGLETDPRTDFDRRSANDGPWVASRRNGDRAAGAGRAGSSAGRVRALGNPGWPWIIQEVETGELTGRRVTASVWAMHPSHDRLTLLQHAIVKITFLDANGREVTEGKTERHFLRANEPTDRWVHAQVSTIAPPSTKGVRLTLLVNARGISSGSVLFDDAALTVEPAAPRFE